jgi:predicted RNA-binding Zn-ribbon protein involved in translation (DUF1610 family)
MIFRRVFRRIFGGNEWSDKGKKDFTVRVLPEGTISAECTICGNALRVEEDEERVWFFCDTCGRQSFYGAEDAARDRRRAAAEDEAVELGLYYYDELPSGTRPPSRRWG